MAFGQLGQPKKRSKAPLVAVVVVAAVVGGAFAVVSANKVGGVPVVVVDAPDAVGGRADVTVTVTEAVRGVVDVTVSVGGAGVADAVVAEVHKPAPDGFFAAPNDTEAKLSFVIGKEVMPTLTEGALTITVTATRAGSWLRHPEGVTETKQVQVKLTPPTVTPMSSFVHAAQGGAEAIVYEVGAQTAKSGVVVERKPNADGVAGTPWFFPGFPLPGGPPTRHVALFVVPYDDDGPEADVRARVKVSACDALGNCASTPFIHKFIPRPMGKDTIDLGDRFLEKVTNEIFPQTPGLQKSGDLLADYLTLNRELRAQNNTFLVELSEKTQAKFLWQRPFQPFGDAAIKGAFADRRTYTRAGAVVDSQDHLGFDLARVERAPINAANDGVVVFAGYLGIYGNCVVVDHGFALMTLYAHLSAIQVKVGDALTRGQTLGLTGATGLAGGDHLHFTTMIAGRATNPIEWWDGHWIADRVKLKLGEAFVFTDDAAPKRRR